jgi:hypothetical protein
MRTLTRSFIALALLVLPSFAFACTPADPYDYPIRGAYLLAFLSAPVALAFELFRFRVASDAERRRLRFGTFVFLLLMLTGLIASSVFRTLESDWRESLPELPAGATTVRC